MKRRIYLTTDNHFFHRMLVEKGHRPANHQDLQIKHWQEQVRPDDIVICLGDFSLGNSTQTKAIIEQLPGRKVLTRGNHDSHTALWYMSNGFDFAADGILYRDIWFSHIPALSLPEGARINIHGHLHDSDPARHNHTAESWHKLLAIEHTNYRLVELDKFLLS